jgi:hypothetical protein
MVANGYLYESHALGRGNLRKWLSILWSNYGPEYLASSIKCAFSSHPPRVFSVRHVPSPFHGGNNCSVSPDRRFVAKSDQTGFLRRARSLSSARSSRLFPIVAPLQVWDYHISHRSWCYESNCKRRLVRPKEKVNHVPNRADMKDRRHMGHVQQIRHVRR